MFKTLITILVIGAGVAVGGYFAFNQNNSSNTPKSNVVVDNGSDNSGNDTNQQSAKAPAGDYPILSGDYRSLEIVAYYDQPNKLDKNAEYAYFILKNNGKETVVPDITLRYTDPETNESDFSISQLGNAIKPNGEAIFTFPSGSKTINGKFIAVEDYVLDVSGYYDLNKNAVLEVSGETKVSSGSISGQSGSGSENYISGTMVNSGKGYAFTPGSVTIFYDSNGNIIEARTGLLGGYDPLGLETSSDTDQSLFAKYKQYTDLTLKEWTAYKGLTKIFAPGKKFPFKILVGSDKIDYAKYEVFIANSIRIPDAAKDLLIKQSI